MILTILFIVACFLAYNNGANDNFKGVATLFGSGTTEYRGAITWATVTTFMGSVASIFLAKTLVKNFSGKGLVPDELILSPEFAISVALGAALTIFIATKIGMPISTTHSLVGALFGSGLLAVGTAFNFEKLGDTFLIPLIVSPLLAAVISLLTYLVLGRLRVAVRASENSLIDVAEKIKPLSELALTDGIIGLLTESYKTIIVVNEEDVRSGYPKYMRGLSLNKLLNYAHFLSAGVVSFARGLNDTPKIVGLLMVINAFDIKWGMVSIAFAMALGGLLNAKKVGETVAKKITPMNAGQGFTANLITGLLVTTASLHGMPVSTTHVSAGSIFGIGTATQKADLKIIRQILFSWILTLPVAAACSATIYWLQIQIF
jgi:PiT family inorganic phosphate transporter